MDNITIWGEYLNILLMTSSYAPVLGGLQTVTQALARDLAREHRVNVVSQRYPRSLPSIEIIDGIKINRWLFLWPEVQRLFSRPILFCASLYYCAYTIIHLKIMMNQFNPDVVNVHFPDAQTPFVLWLRRHFLFRLVVSLHGDEIDRWFKNDGNLPFWEGNKSNKQLHRKIFRLQKLLREADAVTACSKNILEKAIKLESSVAIKGHVIYNGIDVSRFNDKTGYKHVRPYIFAFGRLTKKKGFDLLIQAFGNYVSELRNIDLVIAGEGEEHDALSAQVRQLGLTDHVHIIGRAVPNEIVRLLNSCQFVVVPSREEPFGIVVLEALAAGKPVVATRVGGLLEIVSGPRTCLVEPSVTGLYEGLVLQDYMISLEDADTLRSIASRFSWIIAVKQFERLFYG